MSFSHTTCRTSRYLHPPYQLYSHSWIQYQYRSTRRRYSISTGAEDVLAKYCDPKASRGNLFSKYEDRKKRCIADLRSTQPMQRLVHLDPCEAVEQHIDMGVVLAQMYCSEGTPSGEIRPHDSAIRYTVNRILPNLSNKFKLDGKSVCLKSTIGRLNFERAMARACYRLRKGDKVRLVVTRGDCFDARRFSFEGRLSEDHVHLLPDVTINAMSGNPSIIREPRIAEDRTYWTMETSPGTDHQKRLNETHFRSEVRAHVKSPNSAVRIDLEGLGKEDTNIVRQGTTERPARHILRRELARQAMNMHMRRFYSTEIREATIVKEAEESAPRRNAMGKRKIATKRALEKPKRKSNKKVKQRAAEQTAMHILTLATKEPVTKMAKAPVNKNARMKRERAAKRIAKRRERATKRTAKKALRYTMKEAAYETVHKPMRMLDQNNATTANSKEDPRETALQTTLNTNDKNPDPCTHLPDRPREPRNLEFSQVSKMRIVKHLILGNEAYLDAQKQMADAAERAARGFAHKPVIRRLESNDPGNYVRFPEAASVVRYEAWQRFRRGPRDARRARDPGSRVLENPYREDSEQSGEDDGGCQPKEGAGKCDGL